MGDFNAHLNSLHFLRREDRRCTLLSNFLSFNNLVATNTLPCCQGASSTFVSFNGVYGSIIDHILIPVELLDILSSCTILDDNALNVSSHRPIVCNIQFPLAERTDSRHCTETLPLKWRNLKDSHVAKYKDCEEELCANMLDGRASYDDKDSIDKLHGDIVYVINTASDRSLPRSQGFKHFLKPYWNDTLKV